MNFIVINRDADNTVIPQQVCGQTQARIHHVQPVGMKAPHCLGVAFGGLAGHFPVAFERVLEVILIHKIVARVVRRIDVDHFDLPEIGGLQQFQDFQIVAFDVQILRGLEIDAFFRTRTECCRGALLGQGQAFALALPGELVLLEVLEDVFATKRE